MLVGKDSKQACADPQAGRAILSLTKIIKQLAGDAGETRELDESDAARLGAAMLDGGGVGRGVCVARARRAA